MYFRVIETREVRRIETAVLQPDATLNLITGANGSGKTSLLESIALLCGGRSFRTHRTADIIRRGAQYLSVSGRLRDGGQTETLIGLEKGRDRTRVNVDGERVKSASALMKKVPMLTIGPQSHDLIGGGPRERRRLLDGTLFHVEHDYLGIWRRYHHAMQHRNALLRDRGQCDDMAFWHRTLATEGERLQSHRQACVEALQERLDVIPVTDFTGKISLLYQQGWSQEKSLLEALDAGLHADIRRASTSVGPHRAELQILVDDEPASRVSSRGQAKIVVSALIAAQAQVILEKTAKRPILLLDDIGAELGEEARIMMLQMVLALEGQMFVTAVEACQLPDICKPGAQFHVKHGVVERL